MVVVKIQTGMDILGIQPVYVTHYLYEHSTTSGR